MVDNDGIMEITGGDRKTKMKKMLERDLTMAIDICILVITAQIIVICAMFGFGSI